MEKEDEVTEPAWISKMVNMLKNTEEEFENIISQNPTVNNWTKPSENKLSDEDKYKLTALKHEVKEWYRKENGYYCNMCGKKIKPTDKSWRLGKYNWCSSFCLGSDEIYKNLKTKQGLILKRFL